MRTRTPLWGVVAVFWACTSCSTGPKPPAPGTPAFIWGAAREAYHSGDFRKTSENLLQLVRTESDFTAKARPWSAVMSAGLAQGYYDLAESYEAGARANRANPMPFRKQVTMLRSFASAAALELVETAHLFVANDKDANILLACDYPTGNMAEPANVRKIESGMLMQDSEREQVQTAMLQRGVLRTISRVVGTPDDAAKTLEVFKGGEPKVARPAFVYGLAKSLYDVSALYGPTKLDQPQRTRLLCQQSLEALQSIPETKDTKALSSKIQAALKKIKSTT